jgi:putative membrane protein
MMSLKVISGKVISGVAGLLWLCVSASAADTAFLKDACQGGLLEVKLGELAQTHGSAQGVKEFGQRMVTDHGGMNQEIQDVAGKQNVTLPSDVSLKEKARYELLSRKNGADFDKAYMADMVKDHEEDLAAFQREVDTGTDSNAKAVAMKAIPVIKEHLRMARETAKQVGAAQ